MKKKLLIFFGVSLFFILCFGGIYFYAFICPKLPINGSGYHFYDDSGSLFTPGGEGSLEISDISPNLIKATMAAEDKHFYKHHGFDFLRIFKAMATNIKSGKNLQGASTITQQYSKNLFLDFDKTWERKIKEAWITVRLETHYKKDEILAGYLNTINYGGVFGIENASRYYFNKSSKNLSLAEASMLSGIPKNPSKYSPLINEGEAKKRQKIILNLMVKNNFITEAQANEAYTTELVYQMEKDDEMKMIMYYQDAVLSELKSIKSIPSSFLDTGGLKIYTNLDVKAQNILESSINKNITNKRINK